MTDDFLFVTPRQEEAVAFLETMGKGGSHAEIWLSTVAKPVSE